MNVVFAGIAAIFGLWLHWVVPSHWRNKVLLLVSLAVGWSLWPEATMVAIVLVGIQSWPIEKGSRWKHWLMVVTLSSPLIYQKLGIGQITGLSYVGFLALAHYLDSHKSGEKVSWASRLSAFSLFPLIPAGPIERWANLRPQFENRRLFDRGFFISGLLLIVLGLFKKVVIADRLSELAVDSNKSFLFYSGISMWSYLGLCLLQIYCDFSAVIDIARGICRLFGLEVMDNFNRPYLADSVQDIWRRWHISLVSWLRDTVYNPIAVRTRSVMLASAAVLLLVGLWHGLKWQMILWASYWLILFWLAVLLRTNGWQLGFPIVVRRGLCVLAMAFSTVFMIPDSISELVTVLKRSLFLELPNLSDQKALILSRSDLLVVLAGFAIVLLVEMFMENLAIKYTLPRLSISRQVQFVSACLIAFFLFLTIAFGVSRWENFVYMRY